MKQSTLHKPVGTKRAFWEGRFIFGSDAASCTACLSVLCIVPILWQIEVGTFFTIRWSSWPLQVAMGLLQLASLTLLLCTGLSDPGVIPKQKPYTEAYDPRIKRFRTSVPPRHFETLLGGFPTKLKFCATCTIYRPPRCTHCAICDDCVERFDHHCPWVGNCIGKRNYWLFYGFVSCLALLTVAVFTTSIAETVALCRDFQDWYQAMRHAPLCAIVLVLSTLISWFPVGLWANHTYLICTNQTTYEQIKGTYSDTYNPFERGLTGNCRDVLCSRVRPSYLRSAREVLRCGLAGEPPAKLPKTKAQSDEASAMDFDSVVPSPASSHRLRLATPSEVPPTTPAPDLEEGGGGGGWERRTPSNRGSPRSTRAHDGGGVTPPAPREAGASPEAAATPAADGPCAIPGPAPRCE
jgi:palmitoyltransferase ZDHHC9/14/18